MFRLKIIDKYIIGKYLGTFAFTLSVFVIIIFVFDLSEKVDDFNNSHLGLWGILSEYFAGAIPFYINMLWPLINFIAVLFFTAKMADLTEIVPILSGGVSFYRFLKPYFISASIIFILNLLSNLYLIPYTTKIKNDFENTYVFKNNPTTKSNIKMRVDKNTYISIDNFDSKTNVGYRFNLLKFKGDTLIKSIVADQINWDSTSNKWKIQMYSVRNINELKESLTKPTTPLDTALDMRPNDFSPYANVFETIPTTELNEKIAKEKIRGTGVLNDLLFEKYKRYFYPLSAYILTLIGVSLSSKKVRGGIGISLGIGILLSFIYIVLNQFAKNFTVKGSLSPSVAVLLPTFLFLALGLYLLKKAPK